MTSHGETVGSPLTPLGGGVFDAPGARIIDRSGRRRMPIGRSDFVQAASRGTLVDKTALIADVLDNYYAATLFCRPRRFGKTLNMTMMKAFLEAPEAGGLPRDEARTLFESTNVWEANRGAWREYQGAYPVVHLTLSSAKRTMWGESFARIKNAITVEFGRHEYLKGVPQLTEPDAALLARVLGGTASDEDFAVSLAGLCRMLYAYHGRGAVVLIDEYDAPVMAGYTYHYYDQVVDFLKDWLMGALKDGGATLEFVCLTGVQRISKESIFSDLNNLYVDTPLNKRFDERYGFTDAEVEALATYLGHPDCMPEAREWYDGYRFGTQDIYNPWSVVNYLDEGCVAATYWGNTSSNEVVGRLVAKADARTLEDVYTLLEPGGTVEAALDLGVVFPDLGVREGALWSMLYLSGYLTTADVGDPLGGRRRRLRVPDREVAEIFEDEVLRRFAAVAGGDDRRTALQRAIVSGDEAALADVLGAICRDSMSYLDLTWELPCHALLMGLLFGTRGYANPTSNREAGYGRYDIRLEPDPRARGARDPRPLVTVEVKYARDADDAALATLARGALAQIGGRAYDAEPPACAGGRVRWGVAFSGKRVAVACEGVEGGDGDVPKAT